MDSILSRTKFTFQSLTEIKPLSARDLIRKMLKVDPKKRIKSSDVAQRLMELKRDKVKFKISL